MKYLKYGVKILFLNILIVCLEFFDFILEFSRLVIMGGRRVGERESMEEKRIIVF